VRPAVVDGDNVAMNEPCFAALDVVELAEHSLGAGVGAAGDHGIITEIRRYNDGRYVYSVGSFEDDAEFAGLYPEESLRPTGQKAPIETFRMPRPFMHREIVRISNDYEYPDGAGRTGVLDWWTEAPANGEVVLLVWVEDVGELFVVPPPQCTGTGQQRPHKPRGRVSRNAIKGADGEPIDWFVVVDEIDQYL
jgi:hypothetical protein